MKRCRHVPVRTCVGCAQRAPQAELYRLAVGADGALAIDVARRMNGRGGYLHRNESCWEQFAMRKGHVRSLARVVDKSTRAALVTTLRQGHGA